MSRISFPPLEALALALALTLAAQSPRTALGEPAPLRVGVSVRTMAHLNRTDVTAAMKVWIDTIASARGIHADPLPYVFGSVEEQAEALRSGRIDIASAPSDEIIVLEKAAPLAGFYSSIAGGHVTASYLLLVRADSPFKALADLRGKRLMLLTHPTAGLAPAWLDTELVRAGLPARESFFSATECSTKLNPVILPVFFGQADACLVTQQGFQMAGELNPQLFKVLRTLIVSPALIPGIGSHRADLDPALAARFREAILGIGETKTGKHVLTLFQCDGFVEVSEADFAPTRAFLEEHARLMEGARGAVTETRQEISTGPLFRDEVRGTTHVEFLSDRMVEVTGEEWGQSPALLKAWRDASRGRPASLADRE